MFFRPEEVHARSTERPTGGLTSHWLARVANEGVRLDEQDLVALHFDDHLVAAIEARGLDANMCLRYEPANCQRLETSLAEPPMFVVDRDAVLGGLHVERRKRR